MSRLRFCALHAFVLGWIGLGTACEGLQSHLPEEPAPTEDTAWVSDFTDDTSDPQLDSDTDVQGTPAAPELSSFTVTDAGGGTADVAFVLSDADDDLQTLRLTVNGVDHDLSIPSELDTWVPGGTSHILWNIDGISACSATSVPFAGRAIDALGLTSLEQVDSVLMAGSGVFSNTGASIESDDSLLTASNIGTIARPANFTGVAADDSDDDYIRFIPCDSGTWTFSLTWASADTDLDLYLYDAGGSDLDHAFSFANPELVSASLTAGATYYIAVKSWDAAGDSWTITVP